MAYFILNEESLNCVQWAGLVGAFTGAVMVIMGGGDQ